MVRSSERSRPEPRWRLVRHLDLDGLWFFEPWPAVVEDELPRREEFSCGDLGRFTEFAQEWERNVDHVLRHLTILSARYGSRWLVDLTGCLTSPDLLLTGLNLSRMSFCSGGPATEEFPCGLDGQEFSIITGRERLAGLQLLKLARNQVGPEGALALATSPYITRLTDLDLSNNGLGDDGVAALAASPNSSCLLALALDGE